MATATTTDHRPPVRLLDRLTGPGATRTALVAAVILTEVILAAALASGRLSITLLAFLAAGVLALAFAYPMATAVGTLVLGASVFHYDWFAYSVGPLDANGSELLLGALFVVALLRPQTRSWGRAAGTALGIFLALVGVATLVAVNSGSVDLLGSFAWSRVFLVFAFFYCVVRLFSDRRSLNTLLGWAAAIAAVTGAVAVVVSLFAGPASFLQDPAQQFIRSEEGLGMIERVRLPGLSLAYALFWYAAVRTIEAQGRQRTLWGVALAGMFLNIMVSFNRNMWVGLSLGMLAMLVLSGPVVRRRLLGAAAVAVLLIVLLVSSAGQDSRISPLVARGASLTNTEKLGAESSLESRTIENEIAFKVAGENPVVGIGPGVDFGVSFFEATQGGAWVRVSQLFLHNQYLYIWLIAGLPALIAFVSFLLVSLKHAWWRRLRTPRTAAWGVGIASIMLSAYVAIYFSATDMILGISLLAAAIHLHGRQASEESMDRA